jgi:quercetin dioxygenase-like cupin family protein
MANTLPEAEVLPLDSLVTLTPHGIASRVLAKTAAGNLTLFAFDGGQALTEHTSPFDAFIIVLEGEVRLTIGGSVAKAFPGTITRMPANVPHAVEADRASRLLLVMLRDRVAP